MCVHQGYWPVIFFSCGFLIWFWYQGTALLWRRGLHNSMKLWAMLCRATWDKRVIVKSSDKTWSTGRRNANHSSILAVRISWSVWKGKKIWHPKMSLQRSEAVQYTTGEEWRAVTISSRNNGVAGPKWKWYSVKIYPQKEAFSNNQFPDLHLIKLKTL